MKTSTDRKKYYTNRTKRILVIDDDPGILDFIDELLSFRFVILKALDASTGLQLAESERPDLVILDLGLQNQSGHDICRVLRARHETKHIPILIYTGSDDIDSLTQAFEQGADDYVVKNTKPRELVARVIAKIRRLEEQVDEPEILTCGNLKLDSARLEGMLNDKTLALSVLEFHLLRFFVVNKDRVVSRKQILDSVWKDAVVSNRTIDTHMVYLRKKLSGFTHSLATVYGAGYILRESRLKGLPDRIDEMDKDVDFTDGIDESQSAPAGSPLSAAGSSSGNASGSTSGKVLVSASSAQD